VPRGAPHAKSQRRTEARGESSRATRCDRFASLAETVSRPPERTFARFACDQGTLRWRAPRKESSPVGVALLRARRALRELRLGSLDEDSGVAIVALALEEPLRCIVANAAEEPSVVLHRIDDTSEPAFGYNAATAARVSARSPAIRASPGAGDRGDVQRPA